MTGTVHGCYTLLLAAILVACPAPAAAACQAKSGGATVALLELYTSEGCNSCPPADRWLAELPAKGFGQDRVVPLAFHVDYWNDLGWVDPFAQHAFTRRQREFARRTGAATVYTPELILSGREYRRWWSGSFDRALRRINGQPPQADIALRLHRSGKTLRIEGDARVATPAAPAALYVALYENNLRNDIDAGENRGKTLHHAFVVRRLYGPLAVDATGAARFDAQLALPPEWKLADLGIAAFVQEAQGTGVLQALALDLCPSAGGVQKPQP